MARELGEAAIPIAADLSRTDEGRAAGQGSARRRRGRIDILVNNAGQPAWASESLPEADYRYTMDLN